VWEGGIRGNGFVSGWGVPAHLQVRRVSICDRCLTSPQNTTNSNLMHITDWLPTLAYMVNVSVADVRTDGLVWGGTLMVCSCTWTV
jgi:hypothetical protein